MLFKHKLISCHNGDKRKGANTLEKFMNPPVRHKWNAADIREEHRQGRELKRIAKRYCITNKEVRELLGEPKRKAGKCV